MGGASMTLHDVFMVVVILAALVGIAVIVIDLIFKERKHVAKSMRWSPDDPHSHPLPLPEGKMLRVSLHTGLADDKPQEQTVVPDAIEWKSATSAATEASFALSDEDIHGEWNKEEQRYADGCESFDDPHN